MGTRADFYIGRGIEAKWLGSIAWDGSPDGMSKVFLNAKSETKFLVEIKKLSKRDDWTKPEMGWPWPWETSHTTDYAYAYDNGTVYASNYGGPWFVASEPRPRPEFPDMKNVQNVDYGARSGLITVFGVKK